MEWSAHPLSLPHTHRSSLALAAHSHAMRRTNERNLARGLLLVSSAVPLVVGLSYAAVSLHDIVAPSARFIVPPVTGAAKAIMSSTPLLMDSSANLWSSYLGANLTHGIGIAVIGATTLYLGSQHWRYVRDHCRMLVPAAAAATLALGATTTYFMSTLPGVALLVGSGAYLISWVVLVASD